MPAVRCVAMITLPVLDSNQDNINAVAVSRLGTLRIEQLLEDLVIGRNSITLLIPSWSIQYSSASWIGSAVNVDATTSR